MVFWAFIAIIVVLVVLQVVSFAQDWHWGREGGIFGIAFVVLVAGILTIGLGTSSSYPATWERVSHHELRALVTKDQTESHGQAVFFLGFGYASSSTDVVTSVSYIETAKDGGNTIHKVSIDSSVIYEGSEKPFVDDYQKVNKTTNHVWIPWDMSWGVGLDEPQHRFHIPTGSIFKGYEVNP